MAGDDLDPSHFVLVFGDLLVHQGVVLEQLEDQLG